MFIAMRCLWDRRYTKVNIIPGVTFNRNIAQWNEANDDNRHGRFPPGGRPTFAGFERSSITRDRHNHPGCVVHTHLPADIALCVETGEHKAARFQCLESCVLPELLF